MSRLKEQDYLFISKAALSAGVIALLLHAYDMGTEEEIFTRITDNAGEICTLVEQLYAYGAGEILLDIIPGKIMEVPGLLEAADRFGTDW